MSESNVCGICGGYFIPDRKHPHQKYCLSPGCQKERRKKYLRKYGRVWRKLNPDYSRKYWKHYKRKKK